MDWIALVSIIVTVIGSLITFYAIFIDKKKKKKENIDTKDFFRTQSVLPLVNWAKQKNIENDFIELIKRFVLITKNTSFINNKEFDLFIKSEGSSEFIPTGISSWQVCTSDPSITILEKQIKNINKNLDDFNSREISYVFVTPYLIENKNKWKDKLKSHNWKEIFIYDAQDIINWLKIEPSVDIWFKVKHLGFPSGGVVFPDDFWEEWSTGLKTKLDSSIILGGREDESRKVIETIKSSTMLVVQSISREESLTFCIASFINDEIVKDRFFLKCFIVDNPNSFKQLIKAPDQLILIPRFEDDSAFNLALTKGHSVIVPIDLENASNWQNKINLPALDRKAFVNSLVKSGYTEEVAVKLSKESARNISILRRQLEFTRTVPLWAKPENIKDIIPALIAGRWIEKNEKDEALIAKLAGTSYVDYIFKLKKWLYTSDSPIMKIGNFWRLASPLDAWTNGSQFLSCVDFDELNHKFIEVLSEKNSSFEISAKEQLLRAFTNNDSSYSTSIKEGLTQSLIILSVFGNKYKVDLPISSHLYVDNIVNNLLSSSEEIVWKSFEQYLPQIAEASPNSFLNSIDHHLTKEDSVIKKLFREEEGFASPVSYHMGLLWGLENVAWIPEYFSRSVIILAKLSVIDPGGRISNRPYNSLIEIFKPWHYQTLATFPERIEVLKLIAKSEKNIAWDLLCTMLPGNHYSRGMPTNTMRWRLFDKILYKPKTYQEIRDTHSEVIDLLISLFDDSEQKLAKLIKKSASNSLSQKDRNRILDYLEERLDKVVQTEYIAWTSIREILSRHRSCSDANWALKETDLNRYQKLYNKLTPKDDIISSIWLFNDHPRLPQGFKDEDVSFDKIIQDTRTKALKHLYLKFGIKKIVSLSLEVKQPWSYGDTLAQFLDDEDSIIYISNQLKLEQDKLVFVQSFFYRKASINGIDWVFKVFKTLEGLSFDNKALANLFLSIEQTRVLWDRINSLNQEIQDHYWLNIQLRFYHNSISEDLEYGINKLLDYKRYYSAINIDYPHAEKISSKLLVQILEKAAMEVSSEDVRIDGYEIERIFDALDKHNDIERKVLIKLEWLYLTILTSDGNSRNLKNLHIELAKNPTFFIDVLKCLYKSKDDTITEKESKEIDDVQHRNRARQADELLNCWVKIPGVNERLEIDSTILNEWVENVRKLATECGRLDFADIQIGKVLAQYPEEKEGKEIWPPAEICQVIEKINTDSIKSNFSSATFNKRGFSTRGAFDGGNIERGHAKYFEDLANKHRNKFPIVASILSRLAKRYIEDAKRSDKSAEIESLDY